MNRMNAEVTTFLDGLKHPMRAGIDRLRETILGSVEGLVEDVKWNAPNYSLDGQDRITMKIQPQSKIQLILHRGAKKVAMPRERLISDASGMLAWKENDRAVVTFSSNEGIDVAAEAALVKIVADWIAAAKPA